MKKIRELLKTKEYRAKEYPRVVFPEFERCNNYGDILDLFEELHEQNGVFPSQSQYIEEGINRCRAFFSKQGGRISFNAKNKYGDSKNYYLLWNEKTIKAVKNRLARTYRSKLIEYVAEIQLMEMFEVCWTASDKLIDLTLGADIVLGLPEKNQIVYFHVTEASKWGSKWKDKEFRDAYILDDKKKKHYWTRNWDLGHIDLSYDQKESGSTEIVNGNPILKEDYIESRIDMLDIFECTEPINSKSSIFQFHVWLKENEIREDGIMGEFKFKNKGVVKNEQGII